MINNATFDKLANVGGEWDSAFADQGKTAVRNAGGRADE